jgi:signal transduction histidine kinase
MDDKKIQLLEKTYKAWISIQLDETTPVELLDTLLSKDIMGYGTTLEEKIFGVDGVKKLVLIGREQAKHFEDMRFENMTSVQRQIYPDNGVAIFVGEVVLKFKVAGIENIVPLRISTVFIFENNAWKVTHWHVSVAIETAEGDTWHVNEVLLQNQKLEKLVEERTAELKQSLADLKATQQQLIQSEKMASLGELTAGIAHEIQNPLNFVNNFSELNKELVLEANEEFENKDYEEVKAILKDIEANSEKINHHGKRADGIVKGMLQHSRSSSSEKEPTDINKLADEYLRLAYHGLRAKDKSFNANLETDFDENIGKINIIPQDIGRVILNLITNAFYVTNEKKVSSGKNLTGLDSYQPTVSIITKKNKTTVEIIVKDNGNGIPEKVLDKIFQPFFTTKPTGQGTGLGLSMSYDIVTKGHGGDLKVSSIPNEGSTFTIQIPINE